MGYPHLEIERQESIGTVWLNRPEKLNALSEDMWTDIPRAVTELDSDDEISVIVLAGRGSCFSVGIDIELLMSLRADGPSPAASNMRIYELVKTMQKTVNSFAEADTPVIAAAHGYCLGGGINLISACDLRLATVDAIFSIRETKMGLVADLGALQRLPRTIGPAATAEMALTGGDYTGDWAARVGLVSAVYESPDALFEGAFRLAGQIAENSPLVTRGVKRALRANDGRTIDQALEYAAQWNSAFLISNDLIEALSAFSERRKPDFTGT